MNRFEYVIPYEARADLHTSRWSLASVSTRTDGPTADGWLWLAVAVAGSSATMSLHDEATCDADNAVASGTVDVSGLPENAAPVVLSEANGSGMGGSLWLEHLAGDVTGVPALVTLCTDADLALAYCNAAALPVADPACGLAAYCAAATRQTLLLASQLYANELGGYGGPEDRRLPTAARAVPDFRRLAVPDQLRPAAVHMALAMALGACHDRAEETLFSRLRDHHAAAAREAVAGWNLTLNVDPDVDGDADTSRSRGFVPPVRL